MKWTPKLYRRMGRYNKSIWPKKPCKVAPQLPPPPISLREKIIKRVLEFIVKLVAKKEAKR